MRRLLADPPSHQGKARKGTILYRIVWKDKEGDCYPPDMVWYEPAGNIGAGLLAEYEERIATEAAEEEEAAREEAELEELELEEALPAP